MSLRRSLPIAVAFLLAGSSASATGTQTNTSSLTFSSQYRTFVNRMTQLGQRYPGKISR